MKKTAQVLLGAAALVAASVGLAGQASAANPVSWSGSPFFSSPETATNTVPNPHHTVTIQATVFSGSVWATVSAPNVGNYTNLAALQDSNGGVQAQVVHGTNQFNGSIILFAPLFTTVTTGSGTLTSN
ncbi:MAG: hypothetical protein ACREOE_02075 [Gemmatimonadales bacterium]